MLSAAYKTMHNEARNYMTLNSPPSDDHKLCPQSRINGGRSPQVASKAFLLLANQQDI